MRTPIKLALLFLAGAGLSAKAQCGNTVSSLDDPDAFGAGFGGAAAMSADGTLALVAGPVYDAGDGIVRTFRRDDGQWIEGTALEGLGGFGTSLAMSDDGSIAVVAAPFLFAPPFYFNGGAVVILEHDGADWSVTDTWFSPVPGTQYNFGASCDISADGNVIVIGETNILGTEWQGLPDAAYVATRTDGVWSDLTQLVPSPAIDPLINFGHSVAISDDGTLIAVGAPLALNAAPSGIVTIFENQDGVWTQIAQVTRAIAGDSFNSFGERVAFDGHTLVTYNPFESTEGPLGEPSPPVLFYGREPGGGFPATPDLELFQPIAFPGVWGPYKNIAIRGDTLMIGAVGSVSGVMRFQRKGDDWAFGRIYQPDDYEPFSDNPGGFGAGLAFGLNPDRLVVGEPLWTPDFDHYQIGRIHFPGEQVFQNSTFDVEPAASALTVSFDFAGLPIRQLIAHLLGYFDLELPANCDGDDFPMQAAVAGFTINTVEAEFTLDGPMGMPIVISDVEITLSASSDPAPVDDFGYVNLVGMEVQVNAMVKVGPLPAFPFSGGGPQTGRMPCRITGGDGQPLRFEITDLSLDFQPDLGLGDNNPTIATHGPVSATHTSCTADITGEGDLNTNDFFAFLALYQAQDPGADFSPGGGINTNDFFAYLAAYQAGC